MTTSGGPEPGVSGQHHDGRGHHGIPCRPRKSGAKRGNTKNSHARAKRLETCLKQLRGATKKWRKRSGMMRDGIYMCTNKYNHMLHTLTYTSTTTTTTQAFLSRFFCTAVV